MKNADYFCLLSYFEGYGMVIEEAKILNKKIIITDTAAREAIEDYKEGVILQNDKESLYNGLLNIINSYEQTQVSEKYEYNNDEIIEDISKIIEL